MTNHKAEPDIATPAEAARAIGSLSGSDQKRLELIARARASGLSAVDWRDLLQESIARILEGTRRWPTDVPMIAFLAQTMRSIANEQRQRSRVESSAETAPEQTVEDHHASSEVADKLRRIEMRFHDDAKVLQLMAGLRLGETARETQSRSGMSPAEYGAARKRFWRGVTELSGDGR